MWVSIPSIHTNYLKMDLDSGTMATKLRKQKNLWIWAQAISKAQVTEEKPYKLD